jgi:hypothetical protein
MKSKKLERKIERYNNIILVLKTAHSMREVAAAMGSPTSNYCDAVDELKKKGFVVEIAPRYNAETKHWTKLFLAVADMPEYDEAADQPITVETAPKEVKPWLRVVDFTSSSDEAKELRKKQKEQDEKTRLERRDNRKNRVYIQGSYAMIV